MDYSSCTMRNRYELINTAPEAEYRDRVERLKAYMREKGLDVILELNPQLRGTGLWLISDHQATALGIRSDGSILAEYRHCETVAGYLMNRDGTAVEPPAYPNILQTNRIDFGSFCNGTTRVGICHGGKTGIFEEANWASRKRMTAISAELVDVTRDLDTIKSNHSDFEVEMILDTGKMIEKIICGFPGICRRGRLYKDIQNDLVAMTTRLGSPGQFLLGSFGVLDAAGNPGPNVTALPGARAKDGDVICLMIETNGPSNANAAGGRIYSFGEPSESMRELNDACIRATKLGGSLMYPGMPLKTLTQTVMDAVNATEEYALLDYKFVHALGYSEAEDPRADETRPLVANTPVICHPQVTRKGRSRSGMLRVFDTYVAQEGGGKCIFSLPDEIIRL